MLTWAWACHAGKEKVIRWFHFSSVSGTRVDTALIDGNRVYFSQTSHQAAASLVKSYVADVFIFDGVANNTFRDYFEGPFQNKPVVVFVASSQLTVKTADHPMTTVDTIATKAWELHEYEKAATLDGFWQSVDVELAFDCQALGLLGKDGDPKTKGPKEMEAGSPDRPNDTGQGSATEGKCREKRKHKDMLADAGATSVSRNALIDAKFFSAGHRLSKYLCLCKLLCTEESLKTEFGRFLFAVLGGCSTSLSIVLKSNSKFMHKILGATAAC